MGVRVKLIDVWPLGNHRHPHEHAVPGVVFAHVAGATPLRRPTTVRDFAQATIFVTSRDRGSGRPNYTLRIAKLGHLRMTLCAELTYLNDSAYTYFRNTVSMASEPYILGFCARSV